MNITLNGKVVELSNDTVSIADLLKKQNVASPDMVSVQHNNEIIAPDQFERVTLSDNDDLEFLYFMGGGEN